jgi:hypothetical protein
MNLNKVGGLDLWHKKGKQPFRKNVLKKQYRYRGNYRGGHYRSHGITASVVTVPAVLPPGCPHPRGDYRGFTVVPITVSSSKSTEPGIDVTFGESWRSFRASESKFRTTGPKYTLAHVDPDASNFKPNPLMEK